MRTLMQPVADATSSINTRLLPLDSQLQGLENDKGKNRSIGFRPVSIAPPTFTLKLKSFSVQPEFSRIGIISMASSNSVQILGFLLLFAILLQTIAVAVTFVYFTNALTMLKETFSKSSISCLGKANLNSWELLGDIEVQNEDDPCWQVTQQLHFLIEKTMSNRYQKDLSSAVKDEVSRVIPSLTTEIQGSLRTEIAAHLTGNFMRNAQKAGSAMMRRVKGQKIQMWESKKGLAFLHNLQFKNGELIVPRTGLYHIYSQTYFRHTAPSDGSEVSQRSVRNKQMLQYIYKVTSYPNPILLMKNARTTCWSKNTEYGLYSIYQAGVFELKANDRIFVTVSNISVVDMDEESSFFGAFLVS
ncbi:tumor necrosis factor ligand superfamily member 10-like [Polyodon spathula]|uniref:tumor necrosis factor ligand superfamily member 10-like n=1 Tax=Polyodon spathula TaxID=7913 RepID=UPI001B7F6558|nr:tumor necrosis factor ligand superfamily member 10-like [Polyodon spathula]